MKYVDSLNGESKAAHCDFIITATQSRRIKIKFIIRVCAKAIRDQTQIEEIDARRVKTRPIGDAKRF